MNALAGNVRARLARALRNKPTQEEVAGIVGEIFRSSLQMIQPFRAAVRLFVQVCYQVDHVKVATIGHDASTALSNEIQTAIGHMLVAKSTWDESDIEWISAQIDANPKPWDATKLIVLKNMMEHVLGTNWFVATSPNLDVEAQLAATGGRIEDVDAELRWTMEQLLVLRKYGIKSSFTRRGFMPGRDDKAWVMWDYRDLDLILPPIRNRARPIACVSLSTAASQIRDLRVAVKRTAEAQGFELPFPATFVWTLDEHAELKVGSGSGNLPVRDLFVKAGKLGFYEGVRTLLVHHLYDLVVPIVKLRELPDISEGFGQPSKMRRVLEALHLRHKLPVTDLLLPRIKLLEDVTSLSHDLEQELEVAEQETERRTRRRHEVTHHVRKLPFGHRPSFSARQLAKEMGIVLAEHETCVRKHERGEGELITAHRAVTRPVHM